MFAIKFTGRLIEKIDIPKCDVRDELTALQNIIGGYIEVVRIADDAALLVDEKGILKELPCNPSATLFAEMKLVGTALLVGVKQNDDGEEFFTDCPERYLDSSILSCCI